MTRAITLHAGAVSRSTKTHAWSER
jgi:hypothetical protein